jgi:hypothetical protein
LWWLTNSKEGVIVVVKEVERANIFILFHTMKKRGLPHIAVQCYPGLAARTQIT